MTTLVYNVYIKMQCRLSSMLCSNFVLKCVFSSVHISAPPHLSVFYSYRYVFSDQNDAKKKMAISIVQKALYMSEPKRFARVMFSRCRTKENVFQFSYHHHTHTMQYQQGDAMMAHYFACNKL